MASALILASSAFAEMTATSQPVSGLGCTWTSCPSSARPSLIISANSPRLFLFSACLVPLFTEHCRAGGGFWRTPHSPHLAFPLGAQSRCPATRRPLWRAGKAAAAVLLRQKSVLNLRVELCAATVWRGRLCLDKAELQPLAPPPDFGRAELKQSFCAMSSLLAVSSHAGCFVSNWQNGLPGSVELIGVIRSCIFRRKRHYELSTRKPRHLIPWSFTKPPLLLFPCVIRTCPAPFVAAPALFFPPDNFVRECCASVTAGAGNNFAFGQSLPYTYHERSGSLAKLTAMRQAGLFPGPSV